MLKQCSNHLIRIQLNYSKVHLFRFIITKKQNFNLVKELEILNRKVADQTQIEQNYETVHEQCKIYFKFSYINSD